MSSLSPALGASHASPYNVPSTLERATLRLEFPPIYVVVGVYRLITDKSLYIPIWNKWKHGIARGAAVGAGWVDRLYILAKRSCAIDI